MTLSFSVLTTIFSIFFCSLKIQIIAVLEKNRIKGNLLEVSIWALLLFGYNMHVFAKGTYIRKLNLLCKVLRGLELNLSMVFRDDVFVWWLGLDKIINGNPPGLSLGDCLERKREIRVIYTCRFPVFCHVIPCAAWELAPPNAIPQSCTSRIMNQNKPLLSYLTLHCGDLLGELLNLTGSNGKWEIKTHIDTQT
jgi:hypothetical protein